MKFLVRSLCVLVAFAAILGSISLDKHERFRQAFDLDVPFSMDNDERAILQSQVTERLKALSKQLEEIESTVCDGDNAACVEKKLGEFREARKLLEQALSIAEMFKFDTTIPPEEVVR